MPRRRKRNRDYCEAWVYPNATKSKRPCRSAPEFIRAGHMCCWVHSNAQCVEWFTDDIRATLAKIRLRQLRRELERRISKRELERQERIFTLYPPSWDE